MLKQEGYGDGELLNDAYTVRERVFIIEQDVPKNIEQDAIDSTAWHLVYYQDNEPVATGRLFKYDDTTFGIGRVAVLALYRGQGYGARVMGTLLQRAWSQNAKSVEIHAQAHAVTFYEALGFKPVGTRYMEAGIEHLTMRADRPA
jgi:predicted GNAT family N-acyltransferase